jgi:hypothetical protein
LIFVVRADKIKPLFSLIIGVGLRLGPLELWPQMDAIYRPQMMSMWKWWNNNWQWKTYVPREKLSTSTTLSPINPI